MYMLGVVALARISTRELAGSRVLLLALLMVLLLDPWAVLAAGFWLSLGAVALLALFQKFALVSPLANALALLGSLLLLDPFLFRAHGVAAWMMIFIDRLAALPSALAGGFWLLLPRGFPSRWLGCWPF